MVKIGVKTFDSEEFLNNFKDKVDFFEIMAIEKNNYDFLRKFNLPIIIHSQHRSFGVNIADKTKIERNLKSINFAGKIADMTNAKKIILHPGDLDNENCRIETAIEFVKSLDDKRIIIENIPVDTKVKRLCQTPEETKEFLKASKAGFCFDINHAIMAAESLKIDYIDFLKEFLKLKPAHYHFGGQKINSPSLSWKEKEHLALKDSNFDLRETINLLPKNAEITLETTTDVDNTLDDVRRMKEMLGRK